MLDFRKNSINSALRKILKRFHYPLEVMLTCVHWYVAYPLSLRHIEEMMRERGVFVDHATVHRWAIKMVPVLAPPYFVGASTPLASVGGWTRPTSKWPARGSTFTGWLTRWRYGGLPAHCQARYSCCPALLGASHQPARLARKDHHRQEWR